jgi:hypothetical protein
MSNCVFSLSNLPTQLGRRALTLPLCCVPLLFLAWSNVMTELPEHFWLV